MKINAYANKDTVALFDMSVYSISLLNWDRHAFGFSYFKDLLMRLVIQYTPILFHIKLKVNRFRTKAILFKEISNCD